MNVGDSMLLLAPDTNFPLLIGFVFSRNINTMITSEYVCSVVVVVGGVGVSSVNMRGKDGVQASNFVTR